MLLLGNTSIFARAFQAAGEGLYEVRTAGRDGRADYPLDLMGVPPQVEGTPDCIINFIAYFGDDPLQAEVVNTASLIAAKRIAQATGCRHIVDISSIFASRHPDNQYFGVYGLSKAHGSELLQLLCAESGIGCTTLKFSQLYDAQGAQAKHQPMFYRLVRLARAGEDIVLYGTKDPLRNYLYIQDAVDIVRHVVDRAILGEYFCLHPQSVLQSSVARIAMELAGSTSAINFDADKEDLKTVYLPQDMSLYERIGYAPATPLREGIMRVLCHVPG